MRINFFFFLIVISICSKTAKAQHSIFENDTVAFVYYHLDDNDKIATTITYPDISEKDTMLDRFIYVDKSKRIFWNTFNLGRGNEGLALQLWNMGFHDEDESVSDIVKKTPVKSKAFLPTFKASKEGNKIFYRTIGDQSRILLELSLTKSDTVETLPFFMNEGLSESFRFDDLKLTYTGDSMVNIKGMDVPCYCFKSQVIRVTEGMQTFLLNYHQILFEKASLLPVSILQRRCYRAYFKPVQSKTALKGYGINYLTYVIQVR